jgi:Na+/H+ antiporter NhaD/arsenite permease-like protein
MKRIYVKFAALIFLIAAAALIARPMGLDFKQTLAVCAFFSCVLGTLFFWEFRLSFAFVGSAALLITRSIDLDHFLNFASFEVILFLVGMMILIGLLKESGFFAWIVMLILRAKNLTARKFLFMICTFSAFLACAVDEVTSIVFMVAAILEICDYFEINPVPYIIASVITTNIGSSGTVLGNPIGILIAAKAGLTFEDFLFQAFPLMCLALLITIRIFNVIYKHHLRELDEKIKIFGGNEILTRLISVPPDKQLKRALFVFGATLFFIALHRRFEVLLNLQPNTVLLTAPILSAGLVMAWRWKKARGYVERDVEWWTLLFFVFLFAQAGALKFTGATDIFASHIVNWAGHSAHRLTGLVLWVSGFGSSMLDNVVLVAAFIPIIQSFISMGITSKVLWWALLFGGCFGGNITLIGSTANIVALGLIEKEKKLKIGFFQWFRIGLVVGIVTMGVVWALLLLMSGWGVIK